MSNLKCIFFVFLFAISFYKTKGLELVLYQNDTLFLKNEILAASPNYVSLKESIWNSISKDCRKQGFSINVIWKLDNNKLYLQEIKIVDWCSKNEFSVPLNNFFTLENNKYFASWCTSEIEYGKGPILYNGLLINLYTSGGKLYIENGIFRDLTSWKNEKIIPPNSNIHSLDSFIYSNIKWRKFPKKQLEKNASVSISFIIDDCGHLSNFKIIGSEIENNQTFIKKQKVRKRFKTEALRVAKLIPGLPFYKENGIWFKQPRMGIVVVFSEYNKAKFSKLSF